MYAWLTAGIVGITLFITHYNAAFPVASIELKLDKQQAIRKAEEFTASNGFSIAGYDKAVMFISDDSAATYMQRTRGIKRANELIRTQVPAHAWLVRYFKELQKEGFQVQVHPATGAILGFRHSLLEDEKGADLTEEEARARAEKIVVARGYNLTNYELKENTREKEKNRTDYQFEWEKKDIKVNDATLRVTVNIAGDTLGDYDEYLKVPEKFTRDLIKETSTGAILSMISGILTFILVIAALVIVIIRHKHSLVWWKFGIGSGILITALTNIEFLNSIPLLWIGYPDTVSKTVFISLMAGAVVAGSIMGGFSVLLNGAAGESLSRIFPETKLPLVQTLRKRDFNPSVVLPVFVVGYSLGLLFLGYVTVFYLIGTRYFSVWVPLDTAYSNILGTTIPFLFPLTVAAGAAINEEFLFRLFAVSFFKKVFRLAWVGVVLAAMIWAFGHSGYAIFPMYIRGIELTLAGILIGVVFLRYGLESVIIAHFVIDALLIGMPLLRSGNSFFAISGVIAILLALLPIPVMAFLCRKKPA